MSIPLCEPFYLRGRKSLLQRAVLMSLVLGTVGYAAGACWAVAIHVLISSGLDSLSYAYHVPVYSGTAAVALYVVGCWYGRLLAYSQRGTLLASVWLLTVIVILPCLADPETLEVLAGRYPWNVEIELPRYQPRSLNLIPVKHAESLELSYVISLAWATAFIQGSRIWLAPAAISLVVSPLLAGWVQLTMADTFIAQRAIFAGTPSLFEIGWILSYGGCQFAILLLPWGIPFWWPPDADKRPAER